MTPQTYSVHNSTSIALRGLEERRSEASAKSLTQNSELRPPRIPVEIVEAVMNLSSIPLLKVWTLVCKTLLPAARYRLFKKATIRIRSKEDVQLFIRNFSQGASLLSVVTSIREIKLGGEVMDGVMAEAWHAEAMVMLQVLGLVGVTHLTMDMRSTTVECEVFRWLVEESRMQHTLPLPHVRHFELIGASAIPAYRVMEIISLFPRIETLKLHGLRWNVFSTSHYIPFPPLLRIIEADFDLVLDAAVVLFILFDGSNEKPRGHVPNFNLRIDHDYAKTLELHAESDPDVLEEAARYLIRILYALNRVVPTVENLVLEVPMLDMSTTDDVEQYLSQNRYLRELKSLRVNDILVLERDVGER